MLRSPASTGHRRAPSGAHAAFHHEQGTGRGVVGDAYTSSNRMRGKQMIDLQAPTPATRTGEEPDLDMQFPPLPRTVAEVSRLISQNAEVPDTPKLAEIVYSDPVVAGSVLRRINSAYYGLRRRIADLEKAVFLLGFDEICDIVLTTGLLQLRDLLSSERQTGIFEALMRQSLNCASLTKRLADHLGLENRGSAFTLGLLHNAGRLVFLYNRADEYEALWCANEHGFAPNAILEQSTFGTDHAALGARAADHWNMPAFIIDVIRHYPTPGRLQDQELRKSALLLSLTAGVADRLCMEGAVTQQHIDSISALHLLAKCIQLPAAELVSVIEESAADVLAYSAAMITA